MLELLKETVQLNIPLWISLATFVGGWCFGWFFRGLWDGSNSKQRITLEAFIQISIVIIWVVSTSRAVIYGTEYPPYFVNIMFGIVAGSVNRNMGKQILEIIKSMRK